jgi:hypothetical protein
MIRCVSSAISVWFAGRGACLAGSCALAQAGKASSGSRLVLLDGLVRKAHFRVRRLTLSSLSTRPLQPPVRAAFGSVHAGVDWIFPLACSKLKKRIALS